MNRTLMASIGAFFRPGRDAAAAEGIKPRSHDGMDLTEASVAPAAHHSAYRSLLRSSPLERDVDRHERRFPDVLAWMRPCVAALADERTFSTDKTQIINAIAAEVADGGRISKLAFLDALREGAESNLARWTVLTRAAGRVYQKLQSGFPEFEVRSLDTAEQRALYARYIRLRFAQFESSGFIDLFEDLYNACSPSFLAYGTAKTARAAMLLLKQNPRDPDVTSWLDPRPNVVPLSREFVGLQTASQLFLFKTEDGKELEKHLAPVLALGEIVGTDVAKDLLLLACRGDFPSLEYRLYLQRHCALSGPSLHEPLSRLAELCQGTPDESALRVPRIDRVKAVNTSDVRDYNLMMSEPDRGTIESLFAVKLEHLTIQEQFCLLDTLKRLSYAEADSLARSLRKYPVTAARAFIVAEYGRTHGDSLLAWIQSGDPVAVPDRLREFDGCLSALWSFSECLSQHISSLDKDDSTRELCKQLSEAFLRRITDIFLADVRQGGSTYSGNEVIAALKGTRILLEVLADTPKQMRFRFQRIDPDGRNSQPDNLIYSIEDRQTGALMKLKMLFRARESSVGQARWNIELDFHQLDQQDVTEAFRHTVRYLKDGKSVTKSVLRVGLDRDTSQGPAHVSLDIGRGPYSGQSYSTQGCVVGKILAEVGRTQEGHHNVRSFSPDLAEFETFARAVNALRSYFGAKETSPLTEPEPL